MSELSDALVRYLEFGSAGWPQTNEEALSALSVGDRDQAEAILAFTEECWPPENEDLVTATGSVRVAIRNRYPFLSNEALDALAWAWSFWFK